MTTAARSTSTARQIAIATLVAAVGGSIANTVISLLAQAAGADPTVVIGLMPAAYIVFTIVGTLIGAIGWAIIRSRASAPGTLLRWLVPTVVAVTLIPDVLLAISVSVVGGIALALMHLAVATVAVLAYRRFLPLPR